MKSARVLDVPPALPAGRGARGVGFAVALLAAVGCDQGGYQAVTCSKEIPTNGCPVDPAAQECSDPCCAAGYNCTNGEWVLAFTCSSFNIANCQTSAASNSDAATDATSDGAVDSGATSSCIDLNLPPGANANGGPQCIDLELPDCPVGLVQCSPDSCRTDGCDGLFYCTAEGEWIQWGGCAEDGGGVTPVP